MLRRYIPASTGRSASGWHIPERQYFCRLQWLGPQHTSEVALKSNTHSSAHDGKLPTIGLLRASTNRPTSMRTVQIQRPKRIGEAIYALALICLAGCTPLYVWDTHTTATPIPQSADVAQLMREPVATLGPITPAGLQGLSPFLSRGLVAAISEASPSIQGIPSHEIVNLINGQGLAAEYAGLISGFVRSGILEREPLRRIGSAISSRYLLLPGVADFTQVLIDKFEIGGIKMVRNRVTTLRLWLQLWNTQTGQMIWESTGETTVSSALLRPERIVPLDEIGQKLWLRMIKDNLLQGKDRSRFFFTDQEQGNR
jgi:hypothetical protein